MILLKFKEEKEIKNFYCLTQKILNKKIDEINRSNKKCLILGIIWN